MTAGMQVCRYAGVLVFTALLIACGESRDGDDYSDFVYNGMEGGECIESYDGPSEDYSRESEGVCILGGKEFRYRYDAINRFLTENEEARKITGLEGKVDNCADASLAVAAKNYLLTRVNIDVPDQGHIPPGKEYPPENEENETGSDSATETDKGEIEPLIWKGDSVSYSASENIVWITMRNESATDSTTCSGIVINDIWIMTAAHCLDFLISSGDAVICDDCFKVYWTDPDNGERECITDSTPNRSVCSDWKTGLARIHGNYAGGIDSNDDIGLIKIYSGWNENISEARLFNETPSTSWPYYYGLGYGSNYRCSMNYGIKRRGTFDLDNVYGWAMKTDADDDYRFCRGDSGGVWQKWTGAYFLVFGIHSNSQKGSCSEGSDCRDSSGDEETCCAGPSGANQNACRVDQKIDWIRWATLLDCPAYSSYGYSYVRCNE